MSARYLAYCAEHGLTPDEQMAADRVAYPGGQMTGFILWGHAKWRTWLAEQGRPVYDHLTDADHAAFDAWLAAPLTLGLAA